MSSFLLSFGLCSLLISGSAIVGGAWRFGLLGAGAAMLFFALGRIVDRQDAVLHRLRRIEIEPQERREMEPEDGAPEQSRG